MYIFEKTCYTGYAHGKEEYWVCPIHILVFMGFVNVVWFLRHEPRRSLSPRCGRHHCFLLDSNSFFDFVGVELMNLYVFQAIEPWTLNMNVTTPPYAVLCLLQSKAWYWRILHKKRRSPKYTKNNKLSTKFGYNLSCQSKQGSAVGTRNLCKTFVDSAALWLVTLYTEIVSIK